MSEEQLKAFLEKVQGDTSLQEKLKTASDAETVIAIAKETGFNLSAEDIEKTKIALSDEELADISGGNFGDWFKENITDNFKRMYENSKDNTPPPF
jgi:predicted ribosomally synthesized peptide with nif11-like leader